jgi:selenocysteine lyase/cysteine desulfurase
VALGTSIQILSEVGINVIARREEELSEYALRGLRDVPGVRICGS